jgi:hypothetical protein
VTDFTVLDLNSLLPGEPVTSGKALAWYENPIAITEGAAGAPRNRPASMDLRLIAAVDPASMAQATFTDLPTDRDIMFTFQALRAPVGGGGHFRVRFSVDNGAAWSSFGNLTAAAIGGPAPGLDGFMWLGPNFGIASCVLPASNAITPTDSSLIPINTRYTSSFLRPNAAEFQWGSGTGAFSADAGQLIRVFSIGLLFDPLT